MVQCSTLCALYTHYSYCGDVLTRFPSYEPIEVVLDTILMHLKLYVSDFLFMTTDISAEHIESQEVTNHHELSTKSNSCSRLLNMFRFFFYFGLKLLRVSRCLPLLNQPPTERRSLYSYSTCDSYIYLIQLVLFALYVIFCERGKPIPRFE